MNTSNCLPRVHLEWQETIHYNLNQKDIKPFSISQAYKSTCFVKR